MNVYTPTLEELQAARAAFEKNEPRDLFYRAATELVVLAIRGATSLSLSEAVAVLLQTWNRPYYVYRKFDSQHFSDIERLLSSHLPSLEDLRPRSLDSLSSEDELYVKRTFREFELVLGPIGAAKCLHLFAPRFFPLWDNKIAVKYGVRLQGRGRNGERYWRFMEAVRHQWTSLGGEETLRGNPLKAIDEFNYCRHTKGWI
jgi:hypothetical protein